MPDLRRMGRVPMIVILLGIVMLIVITQGHLLTSGTNQAADHSTATPALIPLPVITATVSLNLTPALIPQDWTAAVALIVSNRDGVWLRSEPSHLSWDENIVTLPYLAGVRVIGKPEYEADPGRWWWLVSAESGGIGWVEESSLTVATRNPGDTG